MTRFLVLYEAPTSAMEQMAKATPAQAKAGMDAWMKWRDRNSTSIIDLGNPVGNGARIQQGSTSKSKSTIAGFSIVEGKSIDDVKKMMTDHPHLQMPGATIEVLEFLPMPGM